MNHTHTHIHIVTFEPLGEEGGVGGHDWFYDRDLAEQRFDLYVAQNDPEPTHRVRLWTHLLVDTEGWSADQITEHVSEMFVDNDPEGYPDRDTHPSIDDHVNKICEEAGLGVMVQVFQIIADREEVTDEQLMALTADDVNGYYFHIAKGIDTIENFMLNGDDLA